MKTNALPYFVLGSFIAVIAALHGWAAFAGYQAPACPGTPECYPWGAEGPAAGKWRYESKENYIIINLVQSLILIIVGFLIMQRMSTQGKITSRPVVIWLLAATWAALFFL